MRVKRDHQACLELSFLDKVDEHMKYMKLSRGCSETLQRKSRSLGECQHMLDLLNRRVVNGQGEPGDPFEKCGLVVKYLSTDNGLSTMPAFETGVAKIQAGIIEESKMTAAEKNACKPLLRDQTVESDSSSESESENFLKEFEKSKKRKERESSGHMSSYINCDFILGSAAVVESLWSEFDAFNTKRRSGTSPIVNEMILFLKKNKDLWGIEDVHRANQNRLSRNRSERVERRMAEHEEFLQAMENNLG